MTATDPRAGVPSDGAPMSPLGRLLGFEPAVPSQHGMVSRMTVGPDHTNLAGSVHGGTILALADNTATRMAIDANDGKFMATVDLHAAFLRAQPTGEIRAEASVVRAGARVTVIRTVVSGADGRVLAELTSTHIPA